MHRHLAPEANDAIGRLGGLDCSGCRVDEFDHDEWDGIVVEGLAVPDYKMRFVMVHILKAVLGDATRPWHNTESRIRRLQNVKKLAEPLKVITLFLIVNHRCFSAYPVDLFLSRLDEEVRTTGASPWAFVVTVTV